MKLRYVLADGLNVGDSYINTVLAKYNSANKNMDLQIKQILIPGHSIQTIIIDKNNPNEPLTYQEATIEPSIFNNVVNELIQSVKQSN